MEAWRPTPKTSPPYEWAVPQTLRELRSSIGFASYYHRYVPKFTQLATPLHLSVTADCKDDNARRRMSAKRNITDDWTDDCQQALDALKLALTTAPVLCFADYRLPFIVETDASDRVLAQSCAKN